MNDRRYRLYALPGVGPSEWEFAEPEPDGPDESGMSYYYYDADAKYIRSRMRMPTDLGEYVPDTEYEDGRAMTRQPSDLGLGQIPTTPAALQARIQAEVAEFLAARQKLEQMRGHATHMTPDDLEAWQNALATQTVLEGQLPDVIAAARTLQEGQFNLVLGAQVAAFAARMESHLANVRSLSKRFGTGVASGSGIGWRPVLIAGGVGVGLLWLSRRRR